MVFKDVPLFPLDTVLFPQMILPLHIFEPRYREMISECLKNNTPFGVVLLKQGPSVIETGLPDAPGEPIPHDFGTLAKITEVVKLEDGRMLITTVGTERFRLLTYHREKPYMTGDIEIFPDSPAGENADGLVSEVSHAFEAYLKILMELAGKQIEGLEIPTDSVVLSYVVPNWLQIGNADKQKLLESTSTSTRLGEELNLLQRETEFLRRIKEHADREGESGQEPEENKATEMPLDQNVTYDLGSRFSKN